MLKILFPTNFSKSCENTLNYILGLSKHHDLQVDLINVFDVPTVMTSNMPYGAIEGMVQEKKNATLRELNNWRDLLPSNIRGDIYARYGSYPSSVIQELTEEHNYFLVIMGLRQKYNLLDKYFGSVTLHCIHKTQTPVLAIPFESKFKKLKNILFPTIFQNINGVIKAEKNNLGWINNFIEPFDGHEIYMLHVEENKDIDKPRLTISNKPAPGISYTIASAPNINDSIRLHLKEQNVDLIIFEKIHRNFWENLIHKSTIKEFLFETKIPILLVGDSTQENR